MPIITKSITVPILDTQTVTTPSRIVLLEGTRICLGDVGHCNEVFWVDGKLSFEPFPEASQGYPGPSWIVLSVALGLIIGGVLIALWHRVVRC